MTVYCIEYTFGLFRSAVLTVLSPGFLCTSSLTQHEPQPILQCVISIILALNPKYSSVPATRKKMNKIRTKYYKDSRDSSQRKQFSQPKAFPSKTELVLEQQMQRTVSGTVCPTHSGSCTKCIGHPQRSKQIDTGEGFIQLGAII